MTETRLLADRYQLLEGVGEGGMALVYKARDTRTGHIVAVKFLRPEFKNNPEFLARFHREATAASKMSHHNIVNLLDISEDKDNPYLVFEYVDGKTLKDIIFERGKLPADLAAQIAIRILSALQQTHAAGIIHRDIKPQNILVNRKGYIKVSDFGIARMVDASTRTMSGTKETALGSVHYFSPEQARGEQATAKSDLYSVGVVLYEMLTGTLPFQGDSAVAIALQHVQTDPRPVRELASEVTPAMAAVVMKALAKDPNQRYQSALQMAQALKAALQNPALGATQDMPVFAPLENTGPIPAPRRRRLTRARLGIAVIAMLILTTLLMGSYLIYQNVINIVRVPYVIGETEETARRLTEHAGLVPQIIRQSSSIKRGTVVLQSHDFDFALRRGDVLLITVSSGPVNQPMPGIVGLSQKAAQDMAEGMGLNFLVADKVLNAASVGTVLKQDPAEGDTVAFGQIVKVTVSGGRVTMPDLKGMNLADATRALARLNLTIGRKDELKMADIAQKDTIAAQNPLPNEEVQENTPVTLVVYVYQPDPTKPPQ